ncbi:hypothetical protein OIO90_002688 [Microbotryomycetes sp. JL221]|nr:hypothetical protein OIO90_002688 [Microbotryomycetes sp. JL221]
MSEHPFFKPRQTRPRPHYFSKEAKQARNLAFLRQLVPLSTFVAIGAISQNIVVSILPKHLLNKYHVAALIPIGLLIWSWGLRVLQHFKFVPLDDDDEVVDMRTTAVLPPHDDQEQDDGHTPEMAVLIIGAKARSALGIDLHGNFKRIGDAFQSLWADLEKDPNSGLLNVEGFVSTDTAFRQHVISIGYFRSAADVVKLAHMPRHREIWKFYYGLPVDQQKELSIWHEMYQVKSGGIDVVGVNWKPRGLAAVFSQTPPVDRGDGWSMSSQTDGNQVKDGDSKPWYPILRPVRGKQMQAAKTRMTTVEF